MGGGEREPVLLSGFPGNGGSAAGAVGIPAGTAEMFYPA